jgi:carboxyl-terminal processing protease
MKRQNLIGVIIALALVGCTTSTATQSPLNSITSTPVVTALKLPTPEDDQITERLEIFEKVWGTVNETYFDPNFNGVDWQAVHDEYKPKIEAARDDEAFFFLLLDMCFELGASHLFVLPADLQEQLEPATSAPGDVGIDVRLIDDQYVITAVEPDSAADNAGLRPGYIILEVNGLTAENSEDEILFKLPPFNERRLQGQIIGVILTKMYGEPGEVVNITYLDADGKSQEVSLEYQEREVSPFVGEDLPPMYVKSKSNYFDNGIGYIQFDGFLPPILDDVLTAIQEMQDAPGIIIDIRGNPGGFFPVRKAIASQFFEESTLLWRYITRPGLDLQGFETEAYTDPPETPYLGPVVILVDVLCASSCEEFSGTMQANGRATIIGKRTPGSVLVAGTETLPDGGLFLFPYAQTQTADGTVLEDRGVIPDIEVSLDRKDLLEGIDTQLEAAVQFLEEVIIK